MGQPGNVSLNHAGNSTFWNSSYNSLSKNSANNFLFFKLLIKFLNFSYKYGIYSRKLFFNSVFFNKKINNTFREEKLFRKIRVYSRILNMTNYYLVRRRVASYLNSKFWIYKYSNWVVVNWYSFKVFKFKLYSSNGKFSVNYPSVSHYLSILKLKFGLLKLISSSKKNLLSFLI